MKSIWAKGLLNEKNVMLAFRYRLTPAEETVLNLAVVTNLLPSTGIALPFFSYGGTALAVNLGEMGIVLSISRGRNKTKIQEVTL